ncbi:hypothetical protein H4R20_000148 [Coemansia guatemalensis]|uniref:EF-hand domain-containing protein n=1 Tax=Coemansia guatemalensis TaxID=2761395 RepID=A0A9W8LVR6_9FUNG|nr:hypothetical protein H4R20_000148 [Coemansia guatemalensis]
MAQQQQQMSETEKRRMEYREAFELFDTDGSGSISRKEMGDLMRKMGHNPSAQEIQDMINEVDADNNGEIDFEEFVAMMELQRVAIVIDENLIKKVFNRVDMSDKGILDEYQVNAGLYLLHYVPSEKEVEKIVKEFFAACKGRVDLKGFKSLVYRLPPLKKDEDAELREAFKVFDTDGNGTISIDELGKVMESLGEKLTVDELHAMFAEADKDGNYQIDFYEFKAMMLGK